MLSQNIAQPWLPSLLQWFPQLRLDKMDLPFSSFYVASFSISSLTLFLIILLLRLLTLFICLLLKPWSRWLCLLCFSFIASLTAGWWKLLAATTGTGLSGTYDNFCFWSASILSLSLWLSSSASLSFCLITPILSSSITYLCGWMFLGL